LQETSPKILHSLGAVIGGTATGQAIAIASSPLITRIYGPEIFGLQGIFLGLLSIAMPLAAMRYPLAIVVASTESEAKALAKLSLIIGLSLALFIGILLIGFREWLLVFLGVEALGSLVWFLPLAIFLVAVQDVCDQRSVRSNMFRLIGAVTAGQALITNFIRIGGGLIQPSAVVLIAASSLSYGFQAVFLSAFHRSRSESSSNVSVLDVFLKYKDFPLYRMPADLVSALSQTVPIFLLAILFTPTVAGLYTLSRSVVNLPINIVGTAAGNVLYSRMAEYSKNKRPIFQFVLRLTLVQLIGPGAITGIAALVFPSFFAFAFGETWRDAGEFAQWMSLWVICMLVSIPTVRSLAVIGRQNLHLAFNLLLFVFGTFGMLCGYYYTGTDIGTVAIYSLVTSSIYVIQIIVYLDQVRRFDRRNSMYV